MRTFFYTSLALLAFAGNSVLCRLALGDQSIDAASFTFVRLFSGMVVLALLLRIVNVAKPVDSAPQAKGIWKAPIMLFIYALSFSYAYRFLDTGSGALILFGTVQLVMVCSSVLQGYKLHVVQCLGLFMAFAGFVYLLQPGITAPSLEGFMLMSLAGVAWALYTLAGQQSSQALQDSAHHFYRTWPFLLLLLLPICIWQQGKWTLQGVFLAMLSGGVASGLGYALWYRALNGLSSIQAAVVQLTVPVIASMGGMLFADELLTLRLGIATVLILSGVLIVVLAKHLDVRR